jgi:hypothetical protein
MRLAILCFLASALPALAQTEDRQRAAVPFVIEQRNNALDGIALCSGDLNMAKAQIAALKAELDTAKAELAKQKDAPQ